MYYNARWYDPYLNHMTQPDSIVPDPYNSQDWDRYAYALNNPVRYNDPSGHCAVCGFAITLVGAYFGGRTAFELGTVVIPGQDRASRNAVGGALVTNLSEVINEQSATQGVDPTLTAAVLRHESSAVERRLFTVIPRTIPGIIANTAEHMQWAMQGDTASIGPGQMQVQRALELEQLGYVTPKGSEQGTINALMGNKTSVEYVTGMLHYINDQLNTLDGFSQLPVEEQQRLVLIGYNWGWTGDFLKELKDRGYLGMIDFSKYDNQTLDEYRRWRNRGFEE
jgi:hypothetical protein